MSEPDKNNEHAIRERAYFIWEQEGRPPGQAETHWRQAVVEGRREWKRREGDQLQDEEKILDGRPDVNYPALLTRDVPGG